MHPKPIELGLERVRAVAARLDLPARDIRTLTVAGTNGKGSSTMLAAEAWRAAGFRVGAYTSPHLYRYNERVAIDGEPASDMRLCEAFVAVEQARQGVPLTYFEFGTLAALWLFREARVQVQVLEVGLGGRLDAVNLVDAHAALITSIGLDHLDWLGPDRESVGREKAGVLRAGRPAVLADADMPASVAAEVARLGVPAWQLERDYRWQPAGDAWSWLGPDVTYRKLPPPALAGRVQFQNAAGVIAAIQRLQNELPTPETALRSALPRLALPGRFERRGDLVLDVAHNVEAAQVLAENLRSAGIPGVVLVLGMLQDKPVEAFCQALRPLARVAFAAGLPGPRGLAGETLARRAATAGLDARACADVAEALERARQARQPAESIVVCGSFLTVAAAGSVHG